MRLIDADEIMRALSIFNDTTNGNSHFLNGIETAKELIEDAPTVDPVIHAKWIFDRPHHYRCSSCNAMWGDSAVTMVHCPGCGARMDPRFEILGNDGKLKVFNTDTGKFEVTEDEDTETGK